MRQDFLAVAGHELRSPLAAILGNAELLRDDLASQPDQARLIEIVIRRAQQVGELVNDFFELARLETGAAELDLTTLDLGDAAGDAALAYQPVAAAAGLTLVRETAAVSVSADAAAVRRVLDNLLSNAVKYTPAGVVTVGVRREGDCGVLEVSDTGIGIPADEQVLVFDHLYRASTARARGTTGTGIGLAVTKALVEAQGGTIAVTGRSGGGSVFRVQLPLSAVGRTTSGPDAGSLPAAASAP